jgi:hypothetical protein
VTRTEQDVPETDRFGIWYRFKSLVIFNLLSIAGPAQLDSYNDPRAAVEQDYERRRDLHRARHGKPPVVRSTSRNGGVDPVIVCAVGGVLALVALVVWAVLAG